MTFPIAIHHGASVITIDDDWSGHVLIEQIYVGLRRARTFRDTGRIPPASPSPGSEAENALIETALLHGFRRVEGTATYEATASQIAALMMAAREQGRAEASRDAGRDTAENGPPA
ncbi:hypothetical protein [Methylobacterium sp. Leaf108]|uniref:hypothetical protein n=1 Tax=Methylobacterium sp. Leaf108 TaxID=1736256 RepID=UPI0006F61830|nr:hypothetical protein [Methylobacterium sp. Leaf108]KQP55099.1 hypothetical protein ASF39_05050 [Methylobacterium sp. Leaf108]